MLNIGVICGLAIFVLLYARAFTQPLGTALKWVQKRLPQPSVYTLAEPAHLGAESQWLARTESGEWLELSPRFPEEHIQYLKAGMTVATRKGRIIRVTAFREPGVTPDNWG